jgi:hypothetical protein
LMQFFEAFWCDALIKRIPVLRHSDITTTLGIYVHSMSKIAWQFRRSYRLGLKLKLTR